MSLFELLCERFSSLGQGDLREACCHQDFMWHSSDLRDHDVGKSVGSVNE